MTDAGRDPVAEGKRDTIETIARTWLVRVQSKNRSHAPVASVIEREVIARIGHRPITAVRKPDIYALIESLVDRGHVT